MDYLKLNLKLVLLAVGASSVLLLLVGLFMRQAPSASTEPPEIIAAEADRLLKQAQKDVLTEGTACYQQPISCSIASYKRDARLRLEAIEKIESQGGV